MRLQRITSGATWIPQVDGLRFVAIMGVILFHATGQVSVRGPHPFSLPALLPHGWGWIDSVCGNGGRGVDFFFVLSGFILARPFLRQHRLQGRPVRLGAYFKRRLTRLEPPYILSLLIFTTLECVVLHFRLRTLLPHLLASIFYVHNVTYGEMSAISFVTWSLEVEVQFYILAPLLGLLYKIENDALRRAVFLGLMVAGALLALRATGPRSSLSILAFSQFFLGGFLLADLLEIPRREGHTNWAWDLVSLFGWGLLFLVPMGRYTYVWMPFVIVPVYCAAFYGKASNWLFRQRPIALLGGMCYSLYLLHMLVISTVFRLVEHRALHSDLATFWFQLAAIALPVIPAGVLYYIAVERPCMDPQWPARLRNWLRSPAERHLRPVA